MPLQRHSVGVATAAPPSENIPTPPRSCNATALEWRPRRRSPCQLPSALAMPRQWSGNSESLLFLTKKRRERREGRERQEKFQVLCRARPFCRILQCHNDDGSSSATVPTPPMQCHNDNGMGRIHKRRGAAPPNPLRSNTIEEQCQGVNKDVSPSENIAKRWLVEGLCLSSQLLQAFRNDHRNNKNARRYSLRPKKQNGIFIGLRCGM